jgi:hypothetical protein
MKYLAAILIAFLFVFTSYAQKAEKPGTDGPDFDIVDFNKKFEVAQWLVEYDNVAWKTTDELMKQDKKDLERLGAEWFCFKDKSGLWHAVYGKLTGATYEPVVHFVMATTEKITKSDAKIDQEFLNSHAISLSTSRAKLAGTIPKDSPRFNQYIKQNSDKTFSVWLLPAFQPNRMAVFGGEAIYTIDATGKKILKDESYFQPNFRGFMADPPREIWLNYREMKKPSLGAIFFVWYYKQYFTKIVIDNEMSTSTVIKTGDGYMWAHVEKDQSKPKAN